MRIRTSRRQTQVNPDGSVVVHEVVTTGYELERIDDFDDLYQCGLARAQRMGQMEAFTERFNIEANCDAQEKAMILALKEYLRPQQAPADLLGRVLDSLDRICGEDTSRELF